MKNSILLLTSMLLLFTSFHFKENPNLQESEAIAAISTDKMNVFYIGVNNPISVAISGVPIEATKVSMDKGTITPTAKLGGYNVRVFEVGKAMIYLEGKDRQGKVVKSSNEFRVKRIPDPSIGNKNKPKSWATSTELKKTIGIFDIFEVMEVFEMLDTLSDADNGALFQVINYEVQYAQKDSPIKIFFNEGANHSSQVLEAIENSQTGDIFYFDNIQVMGIDGITRKHPTISIKIKE